MRRPAAILLLSFAVLGCVQERENPKAIEASSADWAMLDFVKVDSLNPIMQPSPDLSFKCPISNTVVQWEGRNVLNPSAVVREGKVYMIYRAQDQQMTSRLGLAVSEDGLHFTKQAMPVLYPDNDSMKGWEWPGGIEDPRIVESEDGTYILTYTAYDGKTARLCLATSKDLQHWDKKGLVLGDGKYRDTWSKAGAIVARQEGNRMVATKIDGKYWMYFGDTDLFMATSDDLIQWKVAENEENQKMISVLHPRPGYFDSRLVEPGPFALLQKRGILLIYNGSDAANFDDPALPKFTYSAGQALYDRKQPYKLIDRTNTNFIRPDKPFERLGEVNEVCFVEGLVNFKGSWLLYYGTADSKIAVAVR